MTLRNVYLLLACLFVSGCDSEVRAPADKPHYQPWGVALDARGLEVNPGDDFWRFANGKWAAENEIPPERTSHGVWLEVHERAEERVRGIIEELGAADSQPGSPEQKVGDYYSSWMNTAKADELGIAPLQPDLDRIRSIRNADELAAEFGRQYFVSGASPFSAGLGINPKNPDEYKINVGLSGLGLPDRDYYLKDSERFVETRAEYVKHIAKMLGIAGFEDADERAANILALETAIAELQWVRADRRDRDKTYNPRTVAELKEKHSAFNWTAFFESHRMDFLEDIIVNHPDTIDPLIGLVNGQPLETWKDYLSYHLVSGNAAILSTGIDDANFAFFGTVLRGQEKQLDRWKRGVARVGGQSGLGEALGQIYVNRYFPESSKVQMIELVENVRAAYKERIEALEWMGEDTREEALAKLAAFYPKIGYPNKWLDLGDISIAADDLFGNARRIREFFELRDVNKLKTGTDKEEWFMMPQTVNAYYVPNFNQIVFPAAILEAPFFDPNADPAVNYGAIGAVIGHEMGHGFDDQGSKYDARGVKRNWWTDEDRANFTVRTEKLGEQYDTYEAVEGHFVDGSFTMGENIGDLGGVEVAWHAYKLSLNGEAAPVIDGVTGDQRFFMGYAQAWRSERRQESLLRQLTSDPHSPPKFRVNGVVRNVDAWYLAFGVTEEDELYLSPENRVRIW